MFPMALPINSYEDELESVLANLRFSAYAKREEWEGS